MNDTKEFSLGAVVTVVDGPLVAPVEEVHELLDWMAGEPLMTHQLPRVADEARPALIEQFPGIEAIRVPDGTDTWAKVNAFLATVAPQFGHRLAVQPMAALEHTSIDPISELRMKRPDVQIIVVDTEDNE